MRAILFALLLVAPLGHTAESVANSPRVDGLYSTERIAFKQNVTQIDGKQLAGSYRYLRFYPDGTVVTASTAVGPNEQPDPKQIATWLTNTNPHVSRGTYTVSGSAIAFKETSGQGSVDNVASLSEGRINNHWRSSINGREGDDQYQFIPLPTE